MKYLDLNTRSGVVGGTLISAASITWSDIRFTILMAVLGAVVSFFVSLFLRYLTRKMRM